MPPDLANQFNPLACQADFTYAMTLKTIEIQDTGKRQKVCRRRSGSGSAQGRVLAQSSIARYRISYRSTQGTEYMVEWDGKTAREQRQLE